MLARRASVVVLSLAALATAAWAQGSAELRKLHDRIVTPDRVLPIADAGEAAELLKTWNLNPANLAPADRAALLRCQVYVALGQGDAATAQQLAAGLVEHEPGSRATLDARYLAACAAADAVVAAEMLTEIGKVAERGERREISRRKRCATSLGDVAPDVEVRVEDMTIFHARRRGERVLLLDFWNTLAPPEEAHAKALVALAKDLGSEPVDLVGVNTDSEARIDEAKKLAASLGYAWPHCFEYKSVNAPITHQAFGAGTPPWEVLIDSYGYNRAIGVITEPAFQYALRAVLAETRGQFERVRPRSREGKQESVAAAPEAKPKSTGELRSDPDAQALLRQAHLFRRTGKKTDARKLYERIVAEYPGTKEAEEARSYLED